MEDVWDPSIHRIAPAVQKISSNVDVVDPNPDDAVLHPPTAATAGDPPHWDRRIVADAAAAAVKVAPSWSMLHGSAEDEGALLWWERLMDSTRRGFPTR